MLYTCDSYKNTECSKTHCYLYGYECNQTTKEDYAVEPENEMRYYLKQIKGCMTPDEDYEQVFEPSYIATATRLPTGAIELAINTTHIKEKIDYILEAYDDEMRLKTNPAIQMQNVMVV